MSSSSKNELGDELWVYRRLGDATPTVSLSLAKPAKLGQFVVAQRRRRRRQRREGGGGRGKGGGGKGGNVGEKWILGGFLCHLLARKLIGPNRGWLFHHPVRALWPTCT